MRDYTTLHSDTDWSKGTWETIQHYTQTHIEVKEHVPWLQSVSECNVV
jgi:hypothetical protein